MPTIALFTKRGGGVIFPLKSQFCTKKKGQKFSAAFGGCGNFLISARVFETQIFTPVNS